MIYPSRQEYIKAIRVIDISVLDSTIKRGKPRQSKRGLDVYSGGFSCVFPIDVDQKTVALRCWTRDIGQLKHRYQAIESYFNQHQLAYFVQHRYIEQGITVNQKVYPILSMEWAKGLRLSDFIDANIKKTEAIRELASEFRIMMQTLHSKQIAHGDLQDGNIIVDQQGSSISLKLIDYDSVFVPSLRGLSNEVVGVPSYQHPLRKQSTPITEHTDYFSELVMYVSLLAYAEKPDLWKKEQSDIMLFGEEDYRDPQHSTMFHELSQFSPRIRFLVQHLRDFCGKKDINQLTPLEKLLVNDGTSIVIIGTQVISPVADPIYLPKKTTSLESSGESSLNGLVGAAELMQKLGLPSNPLPQQANQPTKKPVPLLYQQVQPSIIPSTIAHRAHQQTGLENLFGNQVTDITKVATPEVPTSSTTSTPPINSQKWKNIFWVIFFVTILIIIINSA